MPSVNEGSRTPLGADLAEGVKAISYDQEITFTPYIRVVLPMDGTVFWVRPALLSPSALLNIMGSNDAVLNETPFLLPVPDVYAPFTIQGSLHYSTDTRQEEAESYAANRVVFTALEEVQAFNDINPEVAFIGEWDGIRFAFNSRGSYYKQADLHHYVGMAVYPDMETQIIDNVATLNLRDVVVSNSLPIWLSLNDYTTPYGFSNPGVRLYPSFLAPYNLRPPFATVHIDPAGTEALAMAPLYDTKLSQTQLVQDRVRITLWGVRNNEALDLISCVLQYCLDFEVMGVMNSPVPRDDKRTQSELNILAQKKVVDFQVNYYQSRARDVARKLIQKVIPTYIIQ